MPSDSSANMRTLTEMTNGEAALLVKRLLGSYPSLNLHDPKTYIANLTALLIKYPLWAGERAVETVKAASEFVPTEKALRDALESNVAYTRYGAQWDRGAQETVQGRLSAPPRPTYDELRSKHGENWGIAQETKPPAFASLEQLRERFGSKLDDVPDAPLRNWDQGKAAARVAADLAQRRQGREEIAREAQAK